MKKALVLAIIAVLLYLPIYGSVNVGEQLICLNSAHAGHFTLTKANLAKKHRHIAAVPLKLFFASRDFSINSDDTDVCYRAAGQKIEAPVPQTISFVRAPSTSLIPASELPSNDVVSLITNQQRK